jgi:ubiquinone/menaquinone biosynthesis C-methylase UbiE
MAEPSYDQRRRSFGSIARDYDRFRPGYPAEGIAWVLGREPLRVLDLAAGTGRLSRNLVALGHDVVAVEPDEQMIAVLRDQAEVEVHVGSAEQIPLPDASVDAVMVGQAFHWFDAPAALDEMARVLVPGGSLGLLWNVLDDRVPWVDALTQVTGGEARWSLTHGEPDPDLAPRFTEVVFREFPNPQSMDLAHLLGVVESWSHVFLNERRTELLAAAEAAVRDQLPREQLAQLELPYITSFVRGRRA